MTKEQKFSDALAVQVERRIFLVRGQKVMKHKLAMRLVAALKSRNDLVSVSKTRLRAECRDSGVKVTQKDGKLLPAEGSEMGFLMLLDRRRYTVTLIEKQPETYEAPSRHAASRAD